MPSQERHSLIVHTTYTCPLHKHTSLRHLPHFRGIHAIGSTAQLHKSMMRLMNRLETWTLQQYQRPRLMCRSQIYADEIVVRSWMPLHAWMCPERTSLGGSIAHRHRPRHLSWPALNICYVPYLYYIYTILQYENFSHLVILYNYHKKWQITTINDKSDLTDFKAVHQGPETSPDEDGRGHGRNLTTMGGNKGWSIGQLDEATDRGRA